MGFQILPVEHCIQVGPGIGIGLCSEENVVRIKCRVHKGRGKDDYLWWSHGQQLKSLDLVASLLALLLVLFVYITIKST